MTVDSEQAERDLVWAITSPSLLNTSDERVEPPHPLSPDDVDASDLADFLSQKATHRVGHYFELLVLYYLLRIRRVDVVAHGRALRVAGQTLGELDFLFRDETGRLIHWETAVKFYLCFDDGTASGPEYIGPNAADTFDRKTRRLFDHQLQLPVTDFGDLSCRRAFVKGRVFYHVTADDLKDRDDRLASEHLRGQWLRASEVDQFLTYGKCCGFRRLTKPHWLSPEVVTGPAHSLVERHEFAQQLSQHFAELSAPVHAAAFRTSDNGHTEHTRLFVVSDDWPVRPLVGRRKPVSE